MKKRLFSLMLALLMMFSICSTSVFAEENASNASVDDQDEMVEPQNITGYIALVMQGNTASASDCAVFRDGLLNSGYDYNTVVAFGWDTSTGKAKTNRVTEAEFLKCAYYDVAYYSGHGGKVSVDSVKHPQINYLATSSYGTSSPIDVAEVLDVDSSIWRGTCKIKTTDKLRVLILAACSQLDSSIVKYYARIMRASGVRAIVGYHATAPGTGTDDAIAEKFIAKASEGESVWSSWKQANNYGYNWALLVYEENSNQYYRLPGFPGNTYLTPSITAKIYRYADFLGTDHMEANPASVDEDLYSQILSLPLTLTVVDSGIATCSLSQTRETTCSDVSVPDSSEQVSTYLTDTYGVDLASKTEVEHYVSREEIDEELGVVDGSETILERTYSFHDTYSGVKIADSFIAASIDCDGINNVNDKRKTVASVGESLAEVSTISLDEPSVISEEEAIQIAKNVNDCCDDYEVYTVSLAYAPTEQDVHVLCYEVMSNCGFTYVNVQTGEVIEWI